MLEFVLLAGFAVFAVYITVRSNAAKEEVANPKEPLEVTPPKSQQVVAPHSGTRLDSKQPTSPASP